MPYSPPMVALRWCGCCAIYRPDWSAVFSPAWGTAPWPRPTCKHVALPWLTRRQVVALCGDGGMTMLMGDLLTLVQEKVPVKLVIYNNSFLGFVELEQRVKGLLDTYTELQNPNFAKLAEACNIPGWQVTEAYQSGEGEGVYIFYA